MINGGVGGVGFGLTKGKSKRIGCLKFIYTYMAMKIERHITRIT